MRRTMFLACLLLITAVPALAQRDFADVEMKTIPVAGSVHMLVGAGGNIGVSAGDDGLLIVDDQFKPLAGKIRAALAGIRKGDLKYVLNTHYHGDHVGANEVFGPEASIIAHDNVRKRLVEGITTPTGTEPAPKDSLPVITFSHSVSVHFNGEEIKVIHFPKGHTDGDSVIFFTGSKVVHMGDQMFESRFPFVDLEGGGTVEGYMNNVWKVIEELPADTKVIPGHGDLTDVDGLKAFHTMIKETSGVVLKKMDAGKSLDDIKAEGLPDYEEYSWRFISTERWIETIYNSYSK